MNNSSIAPGEPIFTINVKGKCLKIVYYQGLGGAFQFFSSDKRLYEYIHNQTENAFFDSVFIDTDEKDTFILNTALVSPSCYFEWEKTPESHLRHLFDFFLPIIQKFIADALTGELDNVVNIEDIEEE